VWDKFALIGLFLLPFAISLGPRIAIFGELATAHLRIQDFIVPPLFLFVSGFLMLVTRGQSDTRRVRLAMMASASVFLIAALVIMASAEGVELLIRLGFLYRLAVVPMIAFLVYFGLKSQGNRGLLAVGLGFLISLSLNFAWFFWQFIIGKNYEAWRFASGDPWNWGLVTIGDGAPFPSGQYVVLHLAIALAGTLAARHFWVRFPLAVVSFALVVVLFLTQSRASIASGVVIVALAIYSLFSRDLFHTVLSRFVFLIVLACSALGVYMSLADGRLLPTALATGLQARVSIWGQRVQLVQGAELFGLGPGGHRVAGSGEVHNLYLLLLVDYGVAGVITFLLLLTLLLHVVTFVLAHTSNPTGQAVAFTVLFFVINLLISGFAQDALNPVISSHLFAVLIGALFWVMREIHSWTQVPTGKFYSSNLPR